MFHLQSTPPEGRRFDTGNEEKQTKGRKSKHGEFVGPGNTPSGRGNTSRRKKKKEKPNKKKKINDSREDGIPDAQTHDYSTCRKKRRSRTGKKKTTVGIENLKIRKKNRAVTQQEKKKVRRGKKKAPKGGVPPTNLVLRKYDVAEKKKKKKKGGEKKKAGH